MYIQRVDLNSGMWSDQSDCLVCIIHVLHVIPSANFRQEWVEPYIRCLIKARATANVSAGKTKAQVDSRRVKNNNIEFIIS